MSSDRLTEQRSCLIYAKYNPTLIPLSLQCDCFNRSRFGPHPLSIYSQRSTSGSDQYRAECYGHLKGGAEAPS